MNVEWAKFLTENAAVISDGAVSHFGDKSMELSAAARVNIIADLSHLGIIEFSGEDAGAFLQGQLSCDVKALSMNASAYGSYCSAKGRVLATFLLWRTELGYSMALARDILPSIQKRLGMFVMRSKVKLEDVSDRCVLAGLSSPNGEEHIAKQFPLVPADDHQGAASENGLLLRLSQRRWVVVAGVKTAQKNWSVLQGAFTPVGAAAWGWLEIRAGVPWITQATQDQFVPQMINLELIGGVSFQKGCYPGQEIVARTQYLGKLKRRMYLANIVAEAIPLPGTALYSEDLGDQASGMVVSAQASPNGGFDVLAVANSESISLSIVHTGNPQGPTLSPQPLPYSLK